MNTKGMDAKPDALIIEDQRKEITRLKARNEKLEHVIRAYLEYQSCSDNGDVMGAGNAWQDFLDALNEAARSGE